MSNKNEFNDHKKHEVILFRSCDEAMARKKKLLPCNKQCNQCFACIEHLGGGERRHFTPKK